MHGRLWLQVLCQVVRIRAYPEKNSINFKE
jgi:hypothetical protein